MNTTIHSASEEGYCAKTDYGVPVIRFRKRWTEDEFRGALENNGFRVVERLFTDERDRNKQWVAFICDKGRN